MLPTSNTAPTPILRVRKRPVRKDLRKAPRPEKLPRAYLHLTKEGKLAITIHGFSSGILPDGPRELYSIIDFFGQLDCQIDCDGVPINPTLLLKIYCKLGPFQSKAACRNAALAAARRNSPVLS